MNKIKLFILNIWKKGLIHILTGTFLTKLVSFFGAIFLVRVLSKEDYGILGYLENIYSYVFILAGMGMSNAILRYVVLGKNKQEKYNYFYYSCKRSLLWNFILILAFTCFSVFYPHPEAYQNAVWLLYILLLSLPFQYITDNVLCNERAMFENQRYAILSLVLSATIIIGKIIVGSILGLVGIIFLQIFTYIVLAFVFFYSTKQKHYANIQSVSLSIYQKKELNKYSFQYMITNGLWAIFMLNDIFLLGRFCSPEIIAEYKVAYTIPGSVTLISSSIGIFIAPYFVKNEDNKQWIQINFKKVYCLTSFFVGLVCSVIALLTKPIIWLLYGENYLNVSNIMIILLIAAFFNCGLRYTTANILAAMGKIKYNMLISVIGMLLQLGINIKIIPQYGAIGLAMTSCFIYAFMAFSLFLIFYKKYLKT